VGNVAGLTKGKRCVIVGASSHRSIGWGIARALHREGADLFFSYSSDRSKPHLDALVDSLSGGRTYPRVRCDVANDEDVAALFRRARDHWGGQFDVLVHSVGRARAEELSGSYLDISREGYAFAHSISAFSLVACVREAAPLLAGSGAGSVITITYAASQRVIPDYNVMASAKAALDCHVRYLAAELGPRNIRVNAIAAGPIRTLSATAVKSLASGRRLIEERAPLRRNVDTDEIGDVALFLASDLSRCLTGEILNADNGFHILGM
jgi:enoyl-[acyl-carrier protein] reductase I